MSEHNFKVGDWVRISDRWYTDVADAEEGVLWRRGDRGVIIDFRYQGSNPVVRWPGGEDSLHHTWLEPSEEPRPPIAAQPWQQPKRVLSL